MGGSAEGSKQGGSSFFNRQQCLSLATRIHSGSSGNSSFFRVQLCLEYAFMPQMIIVIDYVLRQVASSGSQV